RRPANGERSSSGSPAHRARISGPPPWAAEAEAAPHTAHPSSASSTTQNCPATASTSRTGRPRKTRLSSFAARYGRRLRRPGNPTPRHWTQTYRDAAGHRCARRKQRYWSSLLPLVFQCRPQRLQLLRQPPASRLLRARQLVGDRHVILVALVLVKLCLPLDLVDHEVDDADR